MRVKWETWAGNKYEGEVIEVDSNVLHIKLDNGTEIAVESDGVIVVSD